MTLGERVLRSPWLALGARIAKLERTGLESRLRGLSTLGIRHGQRFCVGREVDFICPERMAFGDRVTLFGHAVLNAYGTHGDLRVGSDSHLDHFCVVYAQGGVEIGSQCAIAARVTIYSQSNQYRAEPSLPVIHQPVLFDRVVIGDDVWIGAGAIILPGARIGAHSVVAAGAVVRAGDYEPRSILAGVPARKVATRDTGPTAPNPSNAPSSDRTP